jgi:hypothetical protein
MQWKQFLTPMAKENAGSIRVRGWSWSKMTGSDPDRLKRLACRQ